MPTEGHTSPTNSTHTPLSTSSSASLDVPKPSQRSVKRHRSVKSLTREFDEFAHHTAVTPSSSDDVPLSTSPSSLSPPSSIHSLGKPPSNTKSFARSSSGSSLNHERRASVLLASANYPSTLSVGDSTPPHRHRTISASSVNAGDSSRSPSLKLASPAYPSSYQNTHTPTKPASKTAHKASNEGEKENLPPNPIALSLDPATVPLDSSVTLSGTTTNRSGTTTNPSDTTISDSNMKPSSNGDLTSLPSLSVSLDGAESEDNVSSAHQEETDQLGELGVTSSGSQKSLSQMTPAERREHSRRHSRMHSRNLSVFFPQPNTDAEREADAIKADDQLRKPAVKVDTSSLLNVSGAHNDTNLSPSKSRKGHHRKHSVTHGLQEPSSASSMSTLYSASPSVTEFTNIQQPFTSPENPRHAVEAFQHGRSHSSSTLAHFLSTPLTHVFLSLPASHRPLLVFGLVHVVLGASLWMSGQAGDSLAMTGLGYLVVFDASGVLNAVATEWLAERWRNGSGHRLRRPYGPHRIETVLQFSQAIFLLFAAIYVCKESIEHALLEGADEHHDEDDSGLNLPHLLLFVATGACYFSNLVLHNHARLVAACGISTAANEATQQTSARRHGRKTSVLADPSTLAGPLLDVFANPFGVMVLFFSTTLTFASVVMPAFQVAALDKVLASLESAAMLYVAYPASIALGKILLQTAPKQHTVQSVQFMHSLRTVEEHELVTYVAPPNLWQLTPPSSALNTKGSTLSLIGGASSRTAKNASLIASVEVFVRDEASDNDVLDITAWAWRLLAPAVGAAAGLPVGESLRGSIRAGEVVVQVSREGERDRYRREEQANRKDGCGHGHGHDHGHDHHHDHGHHHGHDHDGHSHNHGDDHSHNHGHDHSHNHGHNHSHNQSHNHGHNHSHNHSHNHIHDHHHPTTHLHAH